MSMPVDTRLPHPHLHSLDWNQLCGLDDYGRGTYTAEGITKMCDGLKGSAVTTLECAAAPECLPICQRPLTRPILSPSCPVSHSLQGNAIGAKGAFALAAVLKKTKITKLKCAAAPECSLSCQRPLTPLSTHLCSHMLAVSRKTIYSLKEEPLSPRASRATPRCNRLSRPPGPQITAP